MKNLLSAALISGLLLTTTAAFAQDNPHTTAGQDIKNAGKKIGHKTAEVASKGASRVSDQRLKDKVGPHGEEVYVNGKDQYYYVDGRGKHQYIPKRALKNKH